MTTMEQKNKYIAFISYQRQDEALAKRLQHALEYYKLPVAVVEKSLRYSCTQRALLSTC